MGWKSPNKKKYTYSFYFDCNHSQGRYHLILISYHLVYRRYHLILTSYHLILGELPSDPG